MWLLLPTEDGRSTIQRVRDKECTRFPASRHSVPQTSPGLCTAARRQGNLAANQGAAQEWWWSKKGKEWERAREREGAEADL